MFLLFSVEIQQIIEEENLAFTEMEASGFDELFAADKFDECRPKKPKLVTPFGSESSGYAHHVMRRAVQEIFGLNIAPNFLPQR